MEQWDILNELYKRTRERAEEEKTINLSKAELRILMKERKTEILAAVATYKNCPDEYLKMLAKDESTLVRCCVARNENCPEDILATLKDDPDANVRSYAKFFWRLKTGNR